MTTLAEHAEMLRKWADVLEIPSGSFINDDLRAAADALSSIPEQGVAYRVRHKGDERWALTFTDPRVTPSGAINDEIEAEPLGLITEGLVTPPYSRGVEAALVKGDGASASSPALAPSQPAAVAVTDEMVERAWAEVTAFDFDRAEMRRALEAALRSTP